MEEHWFKNAIIYAVDVHRFRDGDGDGHGDFAGLLERLDYLAELGATCLWLLPFYPTPGRDNGYDVTDYYDVDPRVGTLDDFHRVVRAAGERGIRIIVDLVGDHTSDQHPWFQAARRDPGSRFRAYYTWTDSPPPTPPDGGPIFPGEENAVWTFDEVAGAYYFHRFYAFEPELNTANPEVQGELRRIIDFWLSFGIAGFRIDAAPHLIATHGHDAAPGHDPHALLRDLRAQADARRPNSILLGEVDVDPEKLTPYFGRGDGDELNMLFNFLLNNYLFLALARERATPIVRALKQLPDPPAAGQWANFLRNLDELDLERLTENDRHEVYGAFAPDERMRIYDRGIRRRLAPMLGGDRRRLELAYSLLFSLPGAPVVVYGDEIGMGDDLDRHGRDAVRAPMQWSAERNAGFSEADADALVQPVIADGPFDHREVNVAAQHDDPESLLNWFRRVIRVRRACPEFGFGTWRTFDIDNDRVFAHRCVWKDGIVVALHNLCGEEQAVDLDLRDQRRRRLESLLGRGHHEELDDGIHHVELEPYGYRWLRVVGERT